MPTPAPILNVTGQLYSLVRREVEAMPARGEERDDDGKLVRRALPARDAYEVWDGTVLTDDGGFATLNFLPPALDALGGQLPSVGDRVEYPVRSYVRWEKAGERSYSVVGYSVAGDVKATRDGRHLKRATATAPASV